MQDGQTYRVLEDYGVITKVTMVTATIWIVVCMVAIKVLQPDSKLGDALDLSKEDPQVVARYGKSDEKFAALQDAGVKTVRSLADIGKALAELTGWQAKNA